MKILSSILLASLIGCARPPAASPTNDVAHHEVPAESFTACAGRNVGASCVVQIKDVEALGTCAPAPGFTGERQLFCDGESS